MSDALTVVGTVGSDPEARATSTGRSVTSFRLASTTRVRDPQTGEWRDGETNWYTISAWNDLGRNVHDSIRKGERVLVAGRLRVRRWEKDDRQGTEVEIVAGSVGHDLRWGTTRYTRAAKSAGARTGDREEGAGTVAEPAPEGGDEWEPSAPGGDAADDADIPF